MHPSVLPPSEHGLTFPKDRFPRKSGPSGPATSPVGPRNSRSIDVSRVYWKFETDAAATNGTTQHSTHPAFNYTIARTQRPSLARARHCRRPLPSRNWIPRRCPGDGNPKEMTESILVGVVLTIATVGIHATGTAWWVQRLVRRQRDKTRQIHPTRILSPLPPSYFRCRFAKWFCGQSPTYCCHHSKRSTRLSKRCTSPP